MIFVQPSGNKNTGCIIKAMAIIALILFIVYIVSMCYGKGNSQAKNTEKHAVAVIKSGSCTPIGTGSGFGSGSGSGIGSGSGSGIGSGTGSGSGSGVDTGSVKIYKEIQFYSDLLNDANNTLLKFKVNSPNAEAYIDFENKLIDLDKRGDNIIVAFGLLSCSHLV